MRLSDSIDRIDGTRFRTNILFEGTRTDEWMGIIDGAKMQTDDRTGKIKSLELKLSDMVISSVQEMDVLTLHRDYFRLSRPIERRIYEMARKAVGQDESWSFLMTTLHRKIGPPRGPCGNSARQMKPIFEGDYLPDYKVEYDEAGDLVTFVNRNTMPRATAKAVECSALVRTRISADGMEAARDAAPGWDVHYLAERFAVWWGHTGKSAPADADPLFAKFCTTWGRQTRQTVTPGTSQGEVSGPRFPPPTVPATGYFRPAKVSRKRPDALPPASPLSRAPDPDPGPPTNACPHHRKGPQADKTRHPRLNPGIHSTTHTDP